MCADQAESPVPDAAQQESAYRVDSFEDGSLEPWRQEGTAEGARLHRDYRALGSAALELALSSSYDDYLVDDSPQSESRYRARFRLGLEDFELPVGSEVLLLEGRRAAPPRALFELRLRQREEGLMMVARARQGASGPAAEVWLSSAEVPLPWQVHDVALRWSAPRKAGEDGGLVLALDGKVEARISGLADPQLRLDELRLGLRGAESAARAARLEVDHFVSGDQGDFAVRPLDGALLLEDFGSLDPGRWSLFTPDKERVPRVIPAGSPKSESETDLEFGGGELLVPVPAESKAYVETQLPSAHRHLLVRFDLDPSAVELAPGDAFKVFVARSEEDDQRLFEVLLVRSLDGQLGVSAIGRRWTGGANSSPIVPWPAPGRQTLEFEWWGARSLEAADGRVILRFVGTGEGVETLGLTNYLRSVRTLRFGAAAAVGEAAGGSLLFDRIRVWR
ncbi:MAG: hypothetical protein AAGD01_11370 [Acidobacteriota bacterium]